MSTDSIQQHRANAERYQAEADELRAQECDITAAMYQRYADRETAIAEKMEVEKGEDE